jgi:hypothetical protein
MRPILTLLIVLAAIGPAGAQQSTSFEISEHTFNGGGHPLAGTTLSSARFRLSVDSLGDGIVGYALIATSFSMDSSFAAAYLPPTETGDVGFVDKTTISWPPDKAAGTYNVYRDLITNLAGGGYGDCYARDLRTTSTTDTSNPPPGEGYLYLVTVVNRLEEEGSKGYLSDGNERPNDAPCP